ncbi:unnamed protein product [Diamesa hyperborea]
MDFPTEKLRDLGVNSDEVVHKNAELAMTLMKPDKYEEVKMNLQAKLKFSKVHIFGSRLLGLANENSDLDLFIETDAAKQKVDELSKILKSDKDWKIEKIVTDTRVPIIRAIYCPMNLECDVSFSSGLGVMNTKIVNFMMYQQPEARLLIHYVRHWLNMCGIDFQGYTIALLVIFYMQSKLLLPSVKTMQQDVDSTRLDSTIGGWITQFDDQKTLDDYGINLMTSYKDHVADFFLFYSKFDFKKMVVFPYYGYSINKNDPILQRQDATSSVWDFPMAVCGPLNLANNSAQYVSINLLNKFVGCCKNSTELMKE